jgi:hypothetical protein
VFHTRAIATGDHRLAFAVFVAAFVAGGPEIPVWLKVAHTLFVAVLLPVYLRHYGAANFLWFSDVALLAMVPALWLESSLIASMMALAVLVPELAWALDFLGRLLVRRRLLGLAEYMFDPALPWWLRGLSLFHLFLPALLLWTLARLGYDPRALWAQTLLGETLLVLAYRFTQPAHNINWVFGPGTTPQTRLSPRAYLAIVMVVFPVAFYWPTHLVLRAVLPPPR